MLRRKTRTRPPVGRPLLQVDARGKAFAPLVKEQRLLSDDFLTKLLAYPRYTTFLFLDTETTGLQCRVGRHRATWIFYYDDRRHGRRTYTSKHLGFFPGTTTAEARDAARIWRGKVAAGDLGPGKREAVKVETSLAEYIAYLERQSATKQKPATWAGLVRHLTKKHIAPRFGQWSLAEIAMHPGAVADWHRDITDANGPVVRQGPSRGIQEECQARCVFAPTGPDKCDRIQHRDASADSVALQGLPEVAFGLAED